MNLEAISLCIAVNSMTCSSSSIVAVRWWADACIVMSWVRWEKGLGFVRKAVVGIGQGK